MTVEIISTTLVAASSYDLTDLATAKDELSIATGETGNDAFIGRAISQASTSCANYCNRTFQLETVQDLFVPDRDAYVYQIPGGLNVLQLSRYPVIGATVALTTSGATTLGASTLFVASTAGLAVGQPVSGTGIAAGAVIASMSANVSVTLSLPVTASIAAGAAIAFGPVVTQTSAAGTVTILTAGVDYLVDTKKGWLTRIDPSTGYPATWAALPTSVVYQGGYATIPADVVDATLRIITQRFAGRGRDPLLKTMIQPGVGEQSYWIGTAPGMNGVFTTEISGLLDSYRVPVTG